MNVPFKSCILTVWNWLYNSTTSCIDFLYIIKDSVYTRIKPKPIIKNIEDTLVYVRDNRCSMARFGDAEIKYISGQNIWYQSQNPVLRTKLAEILLNHNPKVIVGVPSPLASLEGMRKHDVDFWRKHYAYFRPYWYNNMDLSTVYYDAFTSRFYLPFTDKSKAPLYVKLWKEIWNERDILIIEGEKTRLGVGNDLFDNAKSVKRILGTNLEGFKHYKEIYDEAVKFPKSCLILAAMGPTAKVFVDELTDLGYQVLDVGHIDIEYEWMRLGVDDKVPIKDKFVNEAGAGKGVGDISDQKYESEIVCRFTH